MAYFFEIIAVLPHCDVLKQAEIVQHSWRVPITFMIRRMHRISPLKRLPEWVPVMSTTSTKYVVKPLRAKCLRKFSVSHDPRVFRSRGILYERNCAHKVLHRAREIRGGLKNISIEPSPSHRLPIEPDEVEVALPSHFPIPPFRFP